MKKKLREKKLRESRQKELILVESAKETLKENKESNHFKEARNNSSLSIKKQSENDGFQFTFKPKIDENSRRIFEKKSSIPAPKKKKKLIKMEFQSDFQYSPYNIHKSSSVSKIPKSNPQPNYFPLDLLKNKSAYKRNLKSYLTNSVSPNFKKINNQNSLRNSSRVTTNNSSNFSNSKKGFIKFNNIKLFGGTPTYEDEYYKCGHIGMKMTKCNSQPNLNVKRSGCRTPSSTIEVNNLRFDSFNKKTKYQMKFIEKQRLMERYRAQMRESEDCTFTPKISSLQVTDDRDTISREIPFINEYVNKMREIRKNNPTQISDISPSKKDYKKFIRIFVNEKCVVNSNIPFDNKQIRKHRNARNSCDKILQNRKKFCTEYFMNS
ncbi:MAG: hypothetical protein MJ252_13300 [archaeon]|nr:hypothetical protein [archaeon]